MRAGATPATATAADGRAGEPGDRAALGIWDALVERSPAAGFAIALALAALVGLADRSTGEEVGLSVFYIGPLALVASRLGRRAADSFAALCALIWLWADISGGHLYSQPWIPFWNAGVRFAIFAIVGRLIVRLHGALETERRLGRTDALTGLQNSRSFYESAERQLRRARGRREPVTIAYMDLDRFKSINDSLGHLAGDRVLRAAAQALGAAVRTTDLVARLGGDEFAVLLVATGAADAERALARLRAQVGESMRSNGWPVTVSIGALTYEIPPDSIEQLVQGADELMYEVKRSGRDAVRHTVVDVS